MKKKYLVIILLISIITLVGCGSKENKEKDNNSNSEKTTDTIKVDNVEVKLDLSNTFNKMIYKYPSNALSSNVGVYTIMDYMNGQEFIFRIAMYYFSRKTIGQVMENSSLSSVDALTYNNATWNVYEGIQDDGKKVINYVTEYNGDAYTITFISDKDLKELAKEFMNNVKFN